MEKKVGIKYLLTRNWYCESSFCILVYENDLVNRMAGKVMQVLKNLKSALNI